MPEPLGSVWADPDKVSQILTNLMENAIKYTPEGGTITVALESDLPHWAWRLINAPAPEFHRKPFQSSSTNLPYDGHQNGPKGLGLGLSDCEAARRDAWRNGLRPE